MKLSELEITAYDLAAIILPGLIGVAEISISAVGFHRTLGLVKEMNVAQGLALAAVGFGVGHVVSQAANDLATISRGQRYFYRARDKYWTAHGKYICERLSKMKGVSISESDAGACDRALDQCLSIVGTAFEKRRVFSLVASLSLSLWLLSWCSLIPGAIRLINHGQWNWKIGLEAFAGAAAALLVALLMWRRLQLYTYFADVTAFHIFEVAAESKVTERKDSAISLEVG